MSLDRGTMGRLSVQRLSKRFTRNKEYDRVDDTSDTRVPLYNEEAFQHGLKFKAKYIGSAEIQKPSSKIDIITAMRRIRYEHKVKGVKKQRCLIDISTTGVKITKRKRRKRKQYTEEQLFMMQHAIYRIFYVSHDSQDLKIFSYITREVPSNTFKCNVFKAYKKRMALHVVRSLGQAFDVCHKLNPRPKKKKTVQTEEKKSEETKTEEKQDEEKKKDSLEEVKEPEKDNSIAAPNQSVNTAQEPIASNNPFEPPLPPLIDLDPLAPFNLPILPPVPSGMTVTPTNTPTGFVGRPRPRPGQNTIQENPMMAGSSDSVKGINISPSVSLGEPLNSVDGDTLSRDQEKQQMSAQLTLITEQLHTERAARIESEARVEHLLMQNKELLSHLQKLMVQLQQLQSLQMSQITPPKSTPPLSKKGQPSPSEMTPPNTDHSEPSNSEVNLEHMKLDSSPEEPPKPTPNVTDELPLLDDINELNDSNSDKVEDFNTIHLVSQDDFDAAFTPQPTNDPFTPIKPDDSTHDQATLDAAFTPTTVTVAS